MKKILCTILILAVMLNMAPAVFAASASGSCGPSASWTFANGTLTISGKGAVSTNDTGCPWDSYIDQIKTIVVKEGITKLGAYTFLEHGQVLEIQLPDSLTEIGAQCFQSCDKLTSITLPKNVSSIGTGDANTNVSSVFSCENLRQILVDEKNDRYYSVDGVLFDRKSDTLECYPMGKPGQSYTVPKGVKVLDYGSFSLAELTELHLPEGLLEIGESAFFRSKLEKINIPSSVKKIGRDAFSQCHGLSVISLPAGLETIEQNIFASCNNLTDVYVYSRDCFISSFRWTLGNRTTIHGYSGSTAYAHAAKYGIPFVDLESGKRLVERATNADYVEQLPDITNVSAPAWLNITCYTNVNPTITGYQPTIVLEKNTANAAYQEILATVNKLTKDCATQHEKAKAISQWVHDYITYRFGYFGQGDTPEGIYSLWNNPTSNCMGYTQLTNFMLYLAGIQTASVSSYDHTWTAAYTDGQWIMVDSTNDVFDTNPNSFPEIENIAFSVDNNLVCVIDDFTGIKLAIYGTSIYDHAEVSEITIPEYITYIYKSAFFLEDAYGGVVKDVVIKGTIGSYAEKYVGEHLGHYTIHHDGDLFIATTGNASEERIPEKAEPGAPKPETSFTDVPANAYYAAAVGWALENDITKGTSKTTFSPNQQCTRGQIVTFLWRAKGSPAPKNTANPFTDVKKSDYYYQAVLWAVENGITNGTSATTFDPGAPCTRAQAATFLWRAEGKNTSGGRNPFRDVRAGNWYYEAVLWAVDNGITNGTSANTFSPNETCIRGQIVTFLYRCMAN